MAAARTNDGNESVKQVLVVAQPPSQCISTSRQLYPCGFKKEARIILSLSVSLAISNILSSYLLIFVSHIFCGHYGGRLMFSASTFAATFVNVTGMSILFGLTVGCDTLFPQSFGGNRRRMGLILQRSLIFQFYGCFFSWTMMWNARRLFSMFNNTDPVINDQADQYVKIMMVSLPMFGLNILLSKYIAAHHMTKALVLINMAVNAVNIGSHYLFMFVLSWGIRGAATALSIDYALLSLCFAGYIRYSSVFKDSWQPVSLECLRGWNEYLKLTMPGLLIIMTEWWVLEIGSLLVARLGHKEIAIQGVACNVLLLAFLIALAIGQAATIRTGTLIAAQCIDEAKNSTRVAYTLGFACILINALFIVLARKWIPRIFLDKMSMDDVDIFHRTEYVLILVAVLHIMDGGQGLQMGILKGVGKQLKGGLVGLVCYYAVGLTLIYIFMFVVRMGINSFWVGLFIGQTLLNVVFAVFVQRIDWKREAQVALHRTMHDTFKLSSPPSHEPNITLVVATKEIEILSKQTSLFHLLWIKLSTATLLFGLFIANVVLDTYFKV